MRAGVGECARHFQLEFGSRTGSWSSAMNEMRPNGPAKTGGAWAGAGPVLGEGKGVTADVSCV